MVDGKTLLIGACSIQVLLSCGSVYWKASLWQEEEILKLGEALETLKREKDVAQRIVQKNMRYQQYLESVTESSDDYSEIAELLMRYATLRDTNADLKNSAKVSLLNPVVSRVSKTKQSRACPARVGFTNEN